MYFNRSAIWAIGNIWTQTNLRRAQKVRKQVHEEIIGLYYNSDMQKVNAP